MSEIYRSYNSFVPEFLRGRPRGVITHCLQRMKKSQRFTKTDMEFRNENGLFQLKSHSGKVHVVDFGVMTNTPSCTCKDWIQYKIPCKHFFAVFEHSEQWKWESLPKHYLESPHITEKHLIMSILLSLPQHQTNHLTFFVVQMIHPLQALLTSCLCVVKIIHL